MPFGRSRRRNNPAAVYDDDDDDDPSMDSPSRPSGSTNKAKRKADDTQLAENKKKARTGIASVNTADAVVVGADMSQDDATGNVTPPPSVVRASAPRRLPSNLSAVTSQGDLDLRSFGGDDNSNHLKGMPPSVANADAIEGSCAPIVTTTLTEVMRVKKQRTVVRTRSPSSPSRRTRLRTNSSNQWKLQSNSPLPAIPYTGSSSFRRQSLDRMSSASQIVADDDEINQIDSANLYREDPIGTVLNSMAVALPLYWLFSWCKNISN